MTSEQSASMRRSERVCVPPLERHVQEISLAFLQSGKKTFLETQFSMKRPQRRRAKAKYDLQTFASFLGHFWNTANFSNEETCTELATSLQSSAGIR